MIKVTEKFYKKLYAIKPSKDFTRKEILNYLNKRITSKTITKLSALITMNEMKMIIQCATLKKSFENDDFFFKYYKVLISRSRKKKDNRNHSLMIKRLINLFNCIQKEGEISQN